MSSDGGGKPAAGAESTDAADADAASGDAGRLPAVDFSTFMLSLGHSAMVHLGEAPDPSGQASVANLSLARQTIDLIALIGEKTKGNLTGEEERIVEQLIYDLRVRYVEATK